MGLLLGTTSLHPKLRTLTDRVLRVVVDDAPVPRVLVVRMPADTVGGLDGRYHLAFTDDHDFLTRRFFIYRAPFTGRRLRGRPHPL